MTMMAVRLPCGRLVPMHLVNGKRAIAAHKRAPSKKPANEWLKLSEKKR